MEISVSDKQKDFINEIAIREGFKDFKVDFNRGSIKGDGYTGTIFLVRIAENSTGKQLDLVLKSAHKGDELRDKIRVDLFYERESYLYSVIFKDFRELEQEFNVKNNFDGVMKYYGSILERNEECLVLENLRETGFKLWNRRIPMDAYHVEVVITQYGKYHALSYAMKTLKPELFSERMKNLCNIFEMGMSEEELEKSMSSMMQFNFKVVEGNAKATDVLQRFEKSQKEFFLTTMRATDKYSVILHGDCWCNNMMFKYKDTNPKEISRINLLDWQLSSIGSPLLDLCYFFYSCSSKECLDNYQSFIKIYHDSITDSLREFGIDVKDIMSFEELEDQWRKFARYGMYMAFLLIKIMLTEEDEVKDFRDIAKEDNIIDSFAGGEISNSLEYNKRVLLVVDHMVDNNFI